MCIKENNNEQNDADLNNVKVPTLKEKKIATKITAAIKLIFEKMLMVPTNAASEKKEQYRWNVYVKRV